MDKTEEIKNRVQGFQGSRGRGEKITEGFKGSRGQGVEGKERKGFKGPRVLGSKEIRCMGKGIERV